MYPLTVCRFARSATPPPAFVVARLSMVRRLSRLKGDVFWLPQGWRFFRCLYLSPALSFGQARLFLLQYFRQERAFMRQALSLGPNTSSGVFRPSLNFLSLN